MCDVCSNQRIKALGKGGAICPGFNVLCIVYRGQEVFASINPDMLLEFEGRLHSSPTSLLYDMRKSVNTSIRPNKEYRTGSGWDQICYEGKTLKQLEADMLQR